LAAFFCTLSNALICPSLYGSQHAVPYSRIGRTSDMYAKLLVLLLPFFMFDAKLLLQPETLLSSKHWFWMLSAILYYISQEHNPVTMVTLLSECKGTYLTQNTIRRQWLPWPLVFYAVSHSLIHLLTLRSLYKVPIYVMRWSSFRAEFISP